jgi:hypothetical protein
MTYGAMIDVVMLSYRTCLSKDCLLILIVRVVLGDLIVLDVLGLAGCGVYIPWGPWVLGPRTLEPRAPGPLGPWGQGSLGPRDPGPWTPMLTLRRHLYTFVFQTLL